MAYKLFTFLLQIWDAVPKPHAHKETPLSEFFDVKIMTYLSSTHVYTEVVHYKVHLFSASRYKLWHCRVMKKKKSYSNSRLVYMKCKL
jgi:hypothetical protein